MNEKTSEAKGMRAEILDLKKQVAKLESEIERVERLEKSIGYHELVLTKKVRDINDMNGKLEGCLNQDHLKFIRKGLRKVERHEDMLFESARYIKEVIRELEKVRQSHLSHAKDHAELIDAHKKENDEKFDALQGRLAISEEASVAKRQEVLNSLTHLERQLLDKLSQVEYQNKLIMKYLKRVDERIFE